jgi:hypothetical protein
MSAPITEAHLRLANQLVASPPSPLVLATLIADSEAAAVQIAMLREYGNLCATNEGLAKECDRLRAEVERLKKQIKDDNRSYGCELRDPYGTIWEQATKDLARAERAEAELATERARLDDLISVNATGAARLAHAKVQLAAEREKVQALRLACERIVAQWDADHDTNPIGAGGLMYTRASFALAATEDAQ